MKKLLLIFILAFLIITVAETSKLRRKDNSRPSLFKRVHVPCNPSCGPNQGCLIGGRCCDNNSICGNDCCTSGETCCDGHICCKQCGTSGSGQ
ncbi:13167_t:CDS:1, partial [Gigaspora rosea]